MPNVTMKARDTIAAKLAECFITIGSRRYNFMQMIDMEAKVEKTKTTVPRLGAIMAGHKSCGMEHRGQFVFSTHNVLHLNLKTYMKEQIYFITKSKDELTSELYSLADFPEVRYENTKIYEFYMKGILGGTAFE